MERYYAGREDGTAWPSLNSIKNHFNGSFNEAREAVGLTKNTPGPARGRRAAGKHRPVRDVRERVRTVRVAEVHTEVVSVPAHTKPDVRVQRVVERVMVPSKADEKLRKQATKAEQRLATAVERLRTARERLREANTTKTTATRTARTLTRRVAALDAREAELRELLRLSQARVRAADAELASTRANKDSTLKTLAEAEEKIASLEQFLDGVDLQAAGRAAEEVGAARAAAVKSAAEKREADQKTVRAEAERRVAEREAAEARTEASLELGRRHQLQEVVVGHARPLTTKEIEALREQGPQGPAVFTAAIKAVAKARAKGSRQELREALRQVASAAVSWSGRL